MTVAHLLRSAHNSGFHWCVQANSLGQTAYSDSGFVVKKKIFANHYRSFSFKWKSDSKNPCTLCHWYSENDYLTLITLNSHKKKKKSSLKKNKVMNNNLLY